MRQCKEVSTSCYDERRLREEWLPSLKYEGKYVGTWVKVVTY
jgi:hypothetical protein